MENEGYEVAAAYDGITALKEAKTNRYDLIILDLMLPGLDGLQVCQKIREQSHVPIIMLTARGDDLDRITGLEAGADDYLPKPFNVRELVARIHSVLRRTELYRSSVICYSDLKMDLDKRILQVGNQKVDLTSKEFDLLTVMIRNPGRVFTRRQLIDLVWGLEYADERTVDVNIRRLREKIEAEPGKPIYILTKWGVGYFLRELV